MVSPPRSVSVYTCYDKFITTYPYLLGKEISQCLSSYNSNLFFKTKSSQTQLKNKRLLTGLIDNSNKHLENTMYHSVDLENQITL